MVKKCPQVDNHIANYGGKCVTPIRVEIEKNMCRSQPLCGQIKRHPWKVSLSAKRNPSHGSRAITLCLCAVRTVYFPAQFKVFFQAQTFVVEAVADGGDCGDWICVSLYRLMSWKNLYLGMRGVIHWSNYM